MSEEIMAANADAGDVAAPEGVAAPTEPEAPASPTEPAPSPAQPAEPTQTQAFAKRLAEETTRLKAEHQRELEAERGRFSASIAKLGMVGYDGKPITTQEQLDSALARKAIEDEAARQQVPVELLSRMQKTETTANQALSELSQYKHREALAKEAETLAKDPTWGEVYKENEAAVREVAEKARCDLRTATLAVYEKIGPPKVDEEAIANKAIKDYLDKKRTYKPVEGAGAAPAAPPSSPKTWEDARKGSLAYLRSLRE
jgi:hypothetical protein